jgi:hypothetical protein
LAWCRRHVAADTDEQQHKQQDFTGAFILGNFNGCGDGVLLTLILFCTIQALRLMDCMVHKNRILAEETNYIEVDEVRKGMT